MPPTPSADNRYDRKKAVTRASIVAAGNALFSARGFEAVTMEDVAEKADLAIRTLYLHFDSKAGILLAYLDDWLDAYVAALCAQPLDAPLADTVAAALARMKTEGWEDDRTFGEMSVAHPVVEFIGEGNPQLAGHLLHSWVRAQGVLVADARERGGYSPEDVFPWARAAALFAGWIGTTLVFREAFAGDGMSTASSHVVGRDITRELGEGIDSHLARE